jgi:hypothetical protein
VVDKQSQAQWYASLRSSLRGIRGFGIKSGQPSFSLSFFCFLQLLPSRSLYLHDKQSCDISTKMPLLDKPTAQNP